MQRSGAGGLAQRRRAAAGDRRGRLRGRELRRELLALRALRVGAGLVSRVRISEIVYQ